MLQEQGSPWGNDPRGEAMQAPDEVAAIVRLHGFGWGTKRIAGALGMQPEYGEALSRGGWLDDDAPVAAPTPSGRAR